MTWFKQTLCGLVNGHTRVRTLSSPAPDYCLVCMKLWDD